MTIESMMDTVIQFTWGDHVSLQSIFSLCVVIAVVFMTVLYFRAPRRQAKSSTTSSQVSPADTLNNYINSRSKLVSMESLQRCGGKINLDDKERKVNTILMNMKHQEFKKGLDGKPFLASMHFICAKPLIDASDVFDVLTMMPKGAALHLHSTGLASIPWVIAELTYLPNLYFCPEMEGPEDTRRIHFRFSSDISTLEQMDKCCGWRLVSDARDENKKEFDDWLYNNMAMVSKDPKTDYPDTYKAWDKFATCLFHVNQFFYTEECFEKYVTKAMEEFYKDNVQYMEIRYGINSKIRAYNNGGMKDEEFTLQKYIEVVKKFEDTHPDFCGVKFIGSSVRTFDRSIVKKDIERSLRYRKTYPKYYAGHDMVIQEDKSNSLFHYIDELLIPKTIGEVLPFFLHAGETSWQNTFIDENIFDAILLGAKRIGHGLAVTKHPVAMEMIKSRGICIEVNPISNQVLGLVEDLRNHPAASLLAQDFPIVISSDDPAPWNAAPMSHDFYVAFMGLGGKGGDLAMLKQLALNSIEYSAMSDEEKAVMVSVWENKWQVFLDQVIDKYECKYM